MQKYKTPDPTTDMLLNSLDEPIPEESQRRLPKSLPAARATDLQLHQGQSKI